MVPTPPTPCIQHPQTSSLIHGDRQYNHKEVLMLRQQQFTVSVITKNKEMWSSLNKIRLASVFWVQTQVLQTPAHTVICWYENIMETGKFQKVCVGVSKSLVY